MGDEKRSSGAYFKGKDYKRRKRECEDILEFRLTQGRHYYKDIDNKILNTIRQATNEAKGEPHAPIGDWVWLACWCMYFSCQLNFFFSSF